MKDEPKYHRRLVAGENKDDFKEWVERTLPRKPTVVDRLMDEIHAPKFGPRRKVEKPRAERSFLVAPTPTKIDRFLAEHWRKS